MMEEWNDGRMGRKTQHSNIPVFHVKLFWRLSWLIKKLVEVLETAEIARGSVWV
jgi:hypothetical protein